jgi:amino acid transporter
MIITEKHIEELYKFTREHFVYHYDVQTELVDHLANDIEQIWVDQPHLAFEQAKDLSFKKFGVFGFMDVLEQKQNAMNKRYAKILWRFTKEWFTLPKVFTTTLIFMLFFVVLQLEYSFIILVTCFFILAGYDLFKFLKNRIEQKMPKKKNAEKRWLLKEMIGTTRSGFSFITFINVFNIMNLFKIDFYSLPLYAIMLTAFGATFLCITFYVGSIILPQKSEELLKETYPEYSMI